MQEISSTLEFSKQFPEAYQALPEAYRHDDCLRYRVITPERITCRPKEGQELALGSWVFLYENGMWVEL